MAEETAKEGATAPYRRQTIREWLDQLEASAAACTSRAEASELLRRSDVAQAERHFHGEALSRLKRVMLDLYARFWNPDPLRD